MLIVWLLSAKSQVSGPAGTLLLPQLPWCGLHCPQPVRPCSPLRLGVGSRSVEALGWLWTPLLLSDIVLQSLCFSLCGGPVGVEGDSLFPPYPSPVGHGLWDPWRRSPRTLPSTWRLWHRWYQASYQLLGLLFLLFSKELALLVGRRNVWRWK